MDAETKRPGGLSEMFSLSLGAALVFFSIFWSVMYPGDPQRFAAAALVFALPQLALAPARRALSSPLAMVAAGGVLALGCAVGSFMELQTARIYVYAAPWFLTAAWYFNVGCLLKGLDLVRRGRRGLALAGVHLAFVLVSAGMAADGFLAKEGVFRTTLKTAPGVMPPVEGYFAPGERSGTFVERSDDEGVALPFELELVSFEVKFYPTRKGTLEPGEDEVKVGGLVFRRAGFAFEGEPDVRGEIPASRAKEAYAVLEVSAGGRKRRIAVPLNGSRRMGDVAIRCRAEKPRDGRITDFRAEVEIRGAPRSFLSVVNVYRDGEKVMENARISVNHPLRVAGWSVYQADWGRYVSLDDWEALPGNLRTPSAFEDYLAAKGIPPCSFFTVARRPGKLAVYAGYLLMFASLLMFLSLRGRRA